ncbi:WXG100 family type VII secretion target [Streptomyces sp. NPDC020983]|uniref:WXG100 family type VII secretion target n=1 Tax=Streptomyces sp. NPDC020983 TaxID=3365106 RepID=UPI00379FB174
MPLPAIWNSSTVTVDPWVLHNASVNASAAVKSIGDVMGAITDRLNELRLSWTGESQERADKFNQDWSAMVTELFGTKDHPENGLLNRFCSGLERAAVTYSRGERAVSNSFAKFEALLAGMDPKLFPDDDGVTDYSKIIANPPETTDEQNGKPVVTHIPTPKPSGDPYLDNAPAETTATDDTNPDEKTAHIHHTSVNQTF